MAPGLASAPLGLLLAWGSAEKEEEGAGGAALGQKQAPLPVLAVGRLVGRHALLRVPLFPLVSAWCLSYFSHHLGNHPSFTLHHPAHPGSPESSGEEGSSR